MAREAVARLGRRARLAYRVLGPPRDAPPLLLVRPLTGSVALWGAFAERLAASVQVIAYDPRGVGASSRAPLCHTTRAMARDALHLLDHLDVHRASVFGLSLGALVASWIAADAPDRVARLVLASLPPPPASVSRRALRFAGHAARLFLGVGPAEERLVQKLLSPAFRRREPARATAIVGAVHRRPAHRLSLLVRMLAAARGDARAPLPQEAPPTLLLFGTLDPFTDGAARRALASELPHARAELIADAGHDLTLERPLLVADRVRAFLQEGEAVA